MRQNVLEALWVAATVVYAFIVGFTLGRGWSDTFTIVGAIVIVIGWIAIGSRRYAVRRHFEKRTR